jgi:MYXO-CTERM domain-containing protein
VVTQDTTTTTLASSANPSVINQSVTFTATVTGSNAAPTGTVSFYDGSMLIGTGTLTATTGAVSTATFSTSILTLGSHNITATYANTLNFGPSSSATLVQVVNLIPSSITITGLISPIYYGQIIGNTAIINVAGFSSGGFSKVYIDNVLVCTLPVAAGTTLACPANTGAGYNSGTHSIYATYTGDPEYAPSTTPTYTVVIQPDNTITTLTSSNNPILTTQTTTFTATVSAPYATPIGSVTFFNGATPLATVPVNAQGVATFTTSLPAGADNIIASYPASLNFNASSTSLTEQVNIPMPRFSLSVTPNPINILVDTAGVATVTTTDIEGFSQPVQLTCSGLPAETTCVFTQSLLPAIGGSTQVTLKPAPPHNCKVATAELSAPTGPGSGLWLAVIGLTLLFARRRRRLLQGLTLAVALFFLPVINGCGNCTDLGVLPGAYAVTITGTSTGTPVLTSSVVVTMNVTY